MVTVQDFVVEIKALANEINQYKKEKQMKMFVPKDLGAPKPFTPGVYKATVTEERVKTSQAGNPLVSVGFTIASQGPMPKENTIGRKVWENFVFTENTLWKVNQLYHAAMGEDIPASDEDGVEVDVLISLFTSAIHNQSVVLTIEKETYQGTERNKIVKIDGV